MRYESSVLPKEGETISTLKPEVLEFVVLSVDHLIAPRSIFTDVMCQQLVTIIVKEKMKDGKQ